jgi:hypothetical protein
MELEELICEQCDSQWQRAKSRGRKPKLCPTCLESSSLLPVVEEETDTEQEIPLAQEPPLEKTAYKPNSKWLCNACGAKIQIGVGINDAPMHKCPKRANRVLPLELV